MGLGNEEVEIGNRLEDTATETLCGTCGDPETLAETGGLAGTLLGALPGVYMYQVHPRT